MVEFKVDENEVETNNNNNDNALNRGLTVAERRHIYGVLLHFKEEMKWGILCAAHLVDPRWSNTIMTEEEIAMGMQQLERMTEAIFGDAELWEAGVRAQIMNIRAKGGIFARREFRALSDSETMQDVQNVFRFLKVDYQNTMADNRCEVALAFLRMTGTNDWVERSFNYYSWAQSAQNNRLNSETMDKKR